MTPSLRRTVRALLLLSLAACERTTVVTRPPPAPLDESEPNDDALHAPWFGRVYPGTSLAIAGHIASNGSDPYDGFAFSTGAPCIVRFVLRPALPAADLDLCVYDPYLDAFIACFDSPNGTETGEIGFAVSDVDFHLVVNSAWASTSYLLEIDVLPFQPGPALDRPVETAQRTATLARVDGYRGRAGGGGTADALASGRASSPVALGWIGVIDADSGELLRGPFAAYPDRIVLGSFR
jgi:hypothetical protein